ncbi:monooxygenase [Micromonospora sp. HM5-17]|uniref:monooxygenase n=1 Tax=Micromonospora sp. HM5-17 TaxID=2487710 RepID=UPI000F49F76D|nr:monooxygenase [Micromonospora sp. HM5-17]ROT29786.1 monooxygenase [Micromonospora sp. HM5-17]
MYDVHRRVRRIRTGAALLAALLLTTACAADPDPAAAPTPTASGPHGRHGGSTPPPPTPLRDGERFLTLSMPEPYRPAPPAGGTDEYRCFLVDPELTSPAYLTGSQFLPQNVEIVHHAIFFRIEPSEVAAVRRFDAESPGPGWTCFGDAGVGQAAWVAHWAPGVNETLLAPGLGYPMPPGSLLAMQVHYNLLTLGNRPVGTDQSGIRLRLADGRTPLDPLVTALLPAPVELPCAPGEEGELCDRTAALRDVARRFGADAARRTEQIGAACRRGEPAVPGNTQSCDHRVTQPGLVHALAGHMHLLGRSIRIDLNPGTPGARTLLDVPVYNFDDQGTHPLPEPVAVKPGDVYRVTCTHDATLRRRLPQLRDLPPRYVVWGEGTSDEMCLGLVIWSPPS